MSCCIRYQKSSSKSRVAHLIEGESINSTPSPPPKKNNDIEESRH